MFAGTCTCESGWIEDLNTGLCTTSVCNYSHMFCMNGGVCSEQSYTCECADRFNYNEWDSTSDVHCEHCKHLHVCCASALNKTVAVIARV